MRIHIKPLLEVFSFNVYLVSTNNDKESHLLLNNENDGNIRNLNIIPLESLSSMKTPKKSHKRMRTSTETTKSDRIGIKGTFHFYCRWKSGMFFISYCG